MHAAVDEWSSFPIALPSIENFLAFLIFALELVKQYARPVLGGLCNYNSSEAYGVGVSSATFFIRVTRCFKKLSTSVSSLLFSSM